MLGVGLSASGSKRDTLGVFITSVTEGGPAEKAGIVEGDRVAAIDGTDLRVPREDAGDGSVSASRLNRLQKVLRFVHSTLLLHRAHPQTSYFFHRAK